LRGKADRGPSGRAARREAAVLHTRGDHVRQASSRGATRHSGRPRPGCELHPPLSAAFASATSSRCRAAEPRVCRREEVRGRQRDWELQLPRAREHTEEDTATDDCTGDCSRCASGQAAAGDHAPVFVHIVVVLLTVLDGRHLTGLARGTFGAMLTCRRRRRRRRESGKTITMMNGRGAAVDAAAWAKLQLAGTIPAVWSPSTVGSDAT